VAARKAASPGIVEKITEFLADNALTQGWRRAVSAPIYGMERALYGDVELLRGKVAKAAATRLAAEVKEPGQYLGTLLAKEFGDLLKTNYDFGAKEAFADADGYLKNVGGNLAAAFQDGQTSPEVLHQVMDWARRHPAGDRALTAPGSAAQLLLGNPVMAYSAVTAGGALGTAAAIEAYDWWMAQQQQAQKDRPLPLQGSAVTG